MIEPRARQRAVPKPPPPTPFDYPVIGGPRRPDNLPSNAIYPHGFYLTLPGRPINTWPWRANNDIVGMIVFGGKQPHIYRLVDKEWRYAGTVYDRDEGRDKLITMHERALQPVASTSLAPRARSRGTKPT